MQQTETTRSRTLGGGLLFATLIAAVCAFAGLATPAWAAGTTSWSSVVSELNSTGSATLGPDELDTNGVNAPLAIQEGKNVTLTLEDNLDLRDQPITVAKNASLTITGDSSFAIFNVGGITLTPGDGPGVKGAVFTVAGAVLLDLSNVSTFTIPCGLTGDEGTGCAFNVTGYEDPASATLFFNTKLNLGSCVLTVQAQGSNDPAEMTVITDTTGAGAASDWGSCTIEAMSYQTHVDAHAKIVVQGGADEAHNAALTCSVKNPDMNTINFLGYALSEPEISLETAGNITMDGVGFMAGLNVTGGTTVLRSQYAGGGEVADIPVTVSGGTLVLGSTDYDPRHRPNPVFDGANIVAQGQGRVELISGTFFSGGLPSSYSLGATTVVIADEIDADDFQGTYYFAFPTVENAQYDLDNATYHKAIVVAGPKGTTLTRPAGVDVTSTTPNVTIVDEGGTPVPVPGDASDVQEAVAAAKGSIVSGMADYANVTTSDGDATWTIAVKDDADPASDVAGDLFAPFVSSLVKSQALTATSVQNSSVTLSLPNATTEAQNRFIEGVLANAAPMPKAATAAAPSIKELIGKTCGVKVTCADETTLSYTFNFTEAAAEPEPPAPEPAPVPIYRLYNPNQGQHLYTSDANEVSYLTARGWTADFSGKPCWHAPAPGSASASYPIMRLYNPNNGDHYFVKASDSHQIDFLIGKGWTKESDCAFWSADASAENVEIHTLYNPNASEDTHLYTSQISEVNHLTAIGWEAQGAIIYGVTPAR